MGLQRVRDDWANFHFQREREREKAVYYKELAPTILKVDKADKSIL